MALDLKKFGTRAASAAVFVAILLSCVLYSYLSFTLFFLIVALWGLNEFYKLGSALGFQPYKVPGYIFATLLYFVFINPLVLNPGATFSQFPFQVLISIPFLLLVLGVFDAKDKPFNNALFSLGGLIYAVLPFALLHGIVAQQKGGTATFEPNLLIGILLLIWANDTFAYLGGSLFGRHKMIARVSPGKTWEGTIIGVLITFGLSFLVKDLLHAGTEKFWLMAGLIVPVMATLGDLLESVLKRQAGVKDTGNVLPGHGGILDRFDSLIFVSPFIWAILQLIY